MKGLPLKAEIIDNRLIISVGIDNLAWAAVNHPKFWEYDLSILDNAKFAQEVLIELNHEKEIGDTLVTKMLDDAIIGVIEQGSEYVIDGDLL